MAELHLFTIYDHPHDFPANFVVRRWIADGGEPRPDPKVWCVADSLEQARASVPEGLTCIRRNPEDDLKIAETWL